MLKISAVITNPPYNADRELISYKFIYKILCNLDPEYINLLIPVSTGDPRIGSDGYEYQYVRKYFYGSDHIVRTYDAYRGYFIFRDKANLEFCNVDGGVECIVYKKSYHGKCHTVFFANFTEQSSFLSYYYFLPEVRLRHKTDLIITKHIFPSVTKYLETRTFFHYVSDEIKYYNACPQDWWVVTYCGAALNHMHEVYGSKRYNMDIRICLKKDFIPFNQDTGINRHRRFIACVPTEKIMCLVSYIASRFFSYMTFIVQTSRHIDRHTFRLIPTAPVELFQHKWSDWDLYSYYKLTNVFVQHIEENTRFMPLTKTVNIRTYEYLASDILAGKYPQFYI
jgi:hypothetical protein